MLRAGAEVRERHLVSAADFRVHLMDLAGEAVRRQPFGHRVRVEKRAIDALRRGMQHSVHSNRVGHRKLLLLLLRYQYTAGASRAIALKSETAARAEGSLLL